MMKERVMVRNEPLRKGNTVEGEEEESEDEDEGEEGEREEDKNDKRGEEEIEEEDGGYDVNDARRQGSSRSSESRISAAQSSLGDAQLKAKVAENELEALRQVLKGKEAWVKAAKENVVCMKRMYPK